MMLLQMSSTLGRFVGRNVHQVPTLTPRTERKFIPYRISEGTTQSCLYSSHHCLLPHLSPSPVSTGFSFHCQKQRLDLVYHCAYSVHHFDAQETLGKRTNHPRLKKKKSSFLIFFCPFSVCDLLGRCKC